MATREAYISNLVDLVAALSILSKPIHRQKRNVHPVKIKILLNISMCQPSADAADESTTGDQEETALAHQADVRED